MSRSLIAVKSSGIGLISQVISLMINFIIRTYFINYFGAEILGIDGVTKDIVSMLSLADMGISSAMVYRLYKHVINGEEDKINGLMAIYKQVYNFIAIIILFIGLILSFFLKHIITDIQLTWKFIYLAYYLYLTSTVSTSLLAYKRMILNADQKSYICTITDTAMNIVFSALKIGIIIILNSYLLYLVLSIIQNIVSNVFVHMYCKKRYPYLSLKGKIDKEVRRELVSDTKNLFAGKIAGYVYNSTDNLIISILKSTVLVGYLSNYKYVSSAMKSMINCMMAPVQSIVGNYLNSTNEKDSSNKILEYYTHIRYIFSIIFVVPFVCLVEQFIRLWAGDSYVLGFSVVVLLAIDFYIGCVYGPLGEYILGLGMFRYEKNVTAIGAVTNLVLSLVGMHIWGVQGVLGGTVVSQVVLWISKSYIIFKYYFQNKKEFFYEYWKKQILNIFVVVFVCTLSIIMKKHMLIGNGYFALVIEAVLIDILALAIYLLVFGRSEEFNYFRDIIITIIRNMRLKNRR